MKNKLYSNNQYIFMVGFVFIVVMRVVDPNQLLSDKEFAYYQNSGGSFSMLHSDGFFSGIFTIIYSFIFGWLSINLTKLKLFCYSALQIALAMFIISIFFKSIIDINYPTLNILIIMFCIQLIYLYIVALCGSYTRNIVINQQYQFLGLLLTGFLTIAGLIFSTIFILPLLSPKRIAFFAFSINQHSFFVANIIVLVIFILQTVKLIFEKNDTIKRKNLMLTISLVIIVLAILVNLRIYELTRI